MLHFSKSCTIELWGSDIDTIATEEISWTLRASGTKDILIILYRERFLNMHLMIERECQEIPEGIRVAVEG